MTILLESANAQEVKFIARELLSGSATAVFTDEQQNTAYSYSVTLFTDRYYTYFSHALTDLKEEREYLLTVTATNEIYRGKVFCTNQTIANYSINNGVYTERETTNAYKLADD